VQQASLFVRAELGNFKERLARPGNQVYQLPMLAQMDAVTKLLREGDPDTVRLVKEQLVLFGEENLRDLEELARVEDGDVSCHVREILNTIRHREAENDFDLYCRFFSDSSGVEPALWQLVPALRPELDIEPWLLKVEQWGRQFSMVISKAVSSRERVLSLVDYMTQELCFRGNTENYYCERNSLLPCVMESRAGIPITLVLLYRMVAIRAGMIVDGINLPGHFIARHEDVLFDPFHKGRILTRQDCEVILFKQNLKLKNCHLHPATPRQILTRVLANLLYVYDLTGECERRARVDSWIRVLCSG
jgi:regulator of sirC expression with transglutaminase-like and TPR domain